MKHIVANLEQTLDLVVFVLLYVVFLLLLVRKVHQYVDLP